MTKTIELGKLSIDFNNDWEQITGKWNWITINFLKLYMEKENQFGTFEIEIYLLGFGIRFYWTWDSKRMDDKLKEFQRIIDDGDFKSFDEWVER